jgi:hypothetical protein
MNTICCVVAALIVFLPISVASAQSGFQSINSWIEEPGARAETQGDSVVVRRGTLRTPRLYSDFVLRFEFRVTASNSQGRVFVRSRFGYGDRELAPLSSRGSRVVRRSRRLQLAHVAQAQRPCTHSFDGVRSLE